jgi:hypothetical protein
MLDDSQCLESLQLDGQYDSPQLLQLLSIINRPVQPLAVIDCKSLPLPQLTLRPYLVSTFSWQIPSQDAQRTYLPRSLFVFHNVKDEGPTSIVFSRRRVFGIQTGRLRNRTCYTCLSDASRNTQELFAYQE